MSVEKVNNHPEWVPGIKLQCWVTDPSQNITAVGLYPGTVLYRQRAIKNGKELFVIDLRTESDFALFGIGTIQPLAVCPSGALYVNRVIEVKEKGVRKQHSKIREIAFG